MEKVKIKQQKGNQWEGKFGMQVEEELVWPKESSKAMVFEVLQVYDRTRLP